MISEQNFSITMSLRLSGFIAEPLVKISQGFLKGTLFESRKGRIVSAFIGIPYGQPPTGNLRFSNPLPAKSWKGVRLADKEANACSQIYCGKYIGEEDCLYLNVFTPILEFQSSKINGSINNNLLPVMVYVHGGGFSKESTNLTAYSPKYFMDKDIIFVSMNYRLGILGFLTTGDSVASGNFGLKDQTLALKWVRKNIHFFGGDPNRVTLVGSSAGGASVNFLALSDATNGLFQQYVIQSGSVMGVRSFRKKSQFKPLVNAVAKKMGCSNINSTILVKCLRRQNVRKLMDAVKAISLEMNLGAWLPTDEVESEDAFLTDSPLNLLAQNKMKDLPVLTGNTVDEALTFTVEYYTDWTSGPTEDDVEEYINASSNFFLQSNVTKFRNVIKDFYFNKHINSSGDEEIRANLTKFVSDSEFFYPQMILMDNMAKTAKNPIYFYSFGYYGNTTLLSMELNVTENFGVTHAEELLYLFPKGSPQFFPGNDEKILNLMVDLWTSFVANGKPTSDEMDDPHLWLPYNENGNYLQIGSIKNNTDPSVTLDKDFLLDRMNFWRENFPMT